MTGTGEIKYPGRTKTSYMQMYDVLRTMGARDDYEKCLNYLQILRRYPFSRDSERIAERETNHEIDEIEETRAAQ